MFIKINGCKEKIADKLVGKADLIGLDFNVHSLNYVPLVNSYAGIIPDYAVDFYKRMKTGDVHKPESKGFAFVGAFENNMMQEVVMRIYNHQLDYVELRGAESPVFIENLRNSVVPDIRKNLHVLKKMPISSVDDFLLFSSYEKVVDYFIFQIKEGFTPDHIIEMMNNYVGRTPFFLSLSLTSDVLPLISALSQNEHFIGVDLNADESVETNTDWLNELRRFCQER